MGMRALQIRRSGVTRERLLALAEEIPGAWLGVKIAVLVLLLDGYRPTFLARLFGVSRMSLTRWVHRLNRQGLAGVVEKPRPGRPTQLTARLRRQVLADLEKSPEQHGLPRAAWDGPTLAVHLRRRFGVHLKVRQAQNWLHRLGYRLTRPGYVYLQAKKAEAEKFHRQLKKTAPSEAPRRPGV
jgi:transposase